MVVASNSLPPIEKLGGEKNWLNWKYQMEFYLGLEELLDVLMGDIHSDDPEEVRKDLRANEIP